MSLQGKPQNSEGHSDTPSSKKHSQQWQSPDRTRRISQYSKDVMNTGHSSHPEREEKLRRISQHSRTTEKGDSQENSEKLRKISHFSRDGGYLKEPTLRGYGRIRAGYRREYDGHSLATSGELEQPAFYQNTYKLEPDATFNPEVVESIIKGVLCEHLKGEQYEKNLMASRCLLLSDIIKERVRQLRLDRFKVVTMVLIGEKKDQAFFVSSRCLWSRDSDNFASFAYSKGNLCAVGIVFGIYQE